MKKRATYLYRFLQEDMQHCREKGFCVITEIECCYQMANKYWLLLRNELIRYQFETVAEEIEFFKKFKPLFTSEIVFYELVYHAELFKPEKKSDLRNLLLREKNRLSKFIWNNADFYDYYKMDDTSRDEIFFVRENNDYSNFPNAPAHDLEAKAATSHDYLVTQIIALERYDKYVEQKLQELKVK
jgi:hypothetical protein